MADLAKFPDRPRSLSPAYKLHRFAPDGALQDTVSVPAHSEAEAKRRARELTQGLRAELWWGGQLLEHFAAADHPVATSIRLLGDAASTPDADV
ncbi:hypothetical protein [Methylobacterium radiodurans]|uniref:Uncharacterized protein n=1 Tax=Methylobacterium radiodurans TaxID=2202828 RepID=A0A2U8VUP7_9HYPH|nr:hypothetical protein [Methylobacterium radiodurans]AWN37191.1 hypothetical protein DK427_16840 [Methylobacterium radiodurans]